MIKKKVWDCIDQNSDMLKKMARDIWENPEVSLEEEYASKLQAKVLEEAGLKVVLGLKDLPTALIAEYGEGKPIIGILGEYDALESLSQDSVPERKVRVQGGHGHGCGHNLLGTGGVGAAIAIKEAIERGELQGTIRYYGCPAEEELIGKLFMLRDGYFDHCDALLYWHPSSNNMPWRVPCLAATSVVFSFKGLTAHAPQAHIGRSALDAVELMNVGANYLREHLPREVMFHYSILGNGIAPNTVPDRCQSWYMMRAPKRVQLDEAFPRLVDVAKGAAMMTGTTLESVEVLGGGNEVIVNQTIADLFVKNMNELGGPSFTEADYKFAKELTDQFTPEQKLRGAKAFQIPAEYHDQILLDAVVPKTDADVFPVSGDADLSWVFPFGAVYCATWPIGVFTHTWQATACTGSDIGFHGMLFASKTLAGACCELMTDENLMNKVKDEFKETSKNLEYKINIGADAVPKKVKLT
ncbi:amidohydrolase [Fusibacter ferrireducens]|uniref:Amidohydrolase n=1 Tax=Fusibacter ferrireducens TaxID=2785058 RepID=A0ABR9ZVT6_9FIRM|nr:amidohydrolase [Fusibacter ferrireducens]MBF4694535.1 amidohydrolase [Fusibacter ferrireducens]